MKKHTLSMAVVVGLISSQINASSVAFNVNGNFTKEALFNGTFATQQQCLLITNAVWVENSFGKECVVYFPANLKSANKNVVFYMGGDQATTNDAFDSTFLSNSIAKKSNEAQYISNRIGQPYIEIGRLGLGASSGDHGAIRRTKAEVEIINSALDKIKAKHKIENLSFAGHSGGGHTIAGIINKRADVKCAVYGSSPLMPELMELASPNKAPNPKYYEPISEASNALKNKTLRSFIVGDTRDYGGWRWKPMVTYAQQARKLGLKVDILALKTNDNLRHNVVSQTQYMAGWCASNLPTIQIIKHTYKTFSY